MAGSKIGIYNNALHLLGERRLSNIFEAREPRYVLDENYNLSLVSHCLEIAQPRFAVKSVKLANPAVSTVHGMDEVYTFPADYVSVLRDPGTHGSIGCFFADEDFTQPINRYLIEGSTVACEVATNIYMRYISSSIQPSGFTPMFTRLVSVYLARECASRINPSRLEDLKADYAEILNQVIASESVKENQFITQKASADLSADQLLIYNLTVAALGQPELRGIADDSAIRLAIDSVYATSELTLLDTIRPKFASRVVALATGSTSSVHDLDNVFALPADFQTILGLWSDSDLSNPIHRFFIESTNIAIEGYDPAYLRYISTASDEVDYSPKFTTALAAYLACELAPRFAPADVGRLQGVLESRVQEAVVSESTKEGHFPQDVPATLSADQLIIYNSAVAAMGLPELRYTDSEEEIRHAIDSVYDLAERTALEVVQPKFATKVVAVTGGAPSAVHGVDNVTALPADFLTITDLWADDELSHPIHRYFIEAENIVIDGYATAYMRYVLKDTAESTWSPGFQSVVAAYIAREIAPRFAPDKVEPLKALLDQRLVTTISLESAKESFFPQVTTSLSATALQVYNIAASSLGVAELRYVDDESALRHALDAIYTTGTNALLESIKPRFATLVVALGSPATSSVHGYDNVFTLPSDFKQLVGVWSDELLDEPVTRYFIEDANISVQNHATVYLRYVSTAAVETLWTPLFVTALGQYLASQVAPRFKPEEASRANKRYESALGASILADGFKETKRPLAATVTLTTATRSLYNKALELLDLPPIISNDDESERKVALDYAWNHKTVETVLELISWGFARASAKLTADDAVEPAWGFQNAFEVPSDWLRMNAISADEYFRNSIPYYRQGDYLYADVEDVYVSYVSSIHTTTVSSWPAYFWNLVAAELATRCGTIENANVGKALSKYEEYMREAFNTDAQRNPPQIIATGRWVGARDWYPTRRNSRRP